MDVAVQTLDETMKVADCVVGVLKKVAYVGERAVVVTLSGPLGAGKTAFVKCLASLLGVSGVVTSPSFVLRSDYDTDDPVFTRLIHVDVYRLEDVSEVDTIGWDTVLLMSQTLVVVEWAERIIERIPDDSFSIDVAIRGDERIFTSDLLTSSI